MEYSVGKSIELGLNILEQLYETNQIAIQTNSSVVAKSFSSVYQDLQKLTAGDSIELSKTIADQATSQKDLDLLVQMNNSFSKKHESIAKVYSAYKNISKDIYESL